MDTAPLTAPEVQILLRLADAVGVREGLNPFERALLTATRAKLAAMAEEIDAGEQRRQTASYPPGRRAGG